MDPDSNRTPDSAPQEETENVERPAGDWQVETQRPFGDPAINEESTEDETDDGSDAAWDEGLRDS